MEKVSISNPPSSFLSRRFVDHNKQSKSNFGIGSSRTSSNNNSGDSRRYDQLPVSSYVLQRQQPQQQELYHIGLQLSSMSKSVVNLDSSSSSTPTDTRLLQSSPVVAAAATDTLLLPSSTSLVTSTVTPSAPLSPSQQQLLVTTPHHIVYSQMPDMLWKHPRLISVPLTAPHLHPVSEDHLDQQRAYFYKRELVRNNAEEWEAERLREQERQQEREKRERDRLEKQKAEQAVHEHFRKSQTLGYKKNSCWNFLGSGTSTPAVSATLVRAGEDQKKRAELNESTLTRAELKEREVPAVISYSQNIQRQKCLMSVSNSKNEFSSSAVCNLNSSSSVGGSDAMVQSGGGNINSVRVQISSPKSLDPVYSNIYHRSSYSPPPSNFMPSDKQQQQKMEQQQLMMKNTMIVGSLSPTGTTTITTATSTGIKSCLSQENADRESLISNRIPSLLQQQHVAAAVVDTQPPSDSQNSVIVKNEGKNFTRCGSVSSSEFATITSLASNTSAFFPHSSNTKLRVNTAVAGVAADAHHHLQPSSNVAKVCDYRVPSSQPSSTLHVSTAAHLLNVSSVHQVHQFTDQQKLHQNRQASACTSPAPRQHQSPLPVPYQRSSSHSRQSPLPTTVQQSSSPMPPYHCLPTSARTGSPTEQPCRHVATAAATSSQSSSVYTKGGVTVGSHLCLTSNVPVPLSLQCPTTCVSVAAKPKVSSPVPSQIYGKPTSGLSSDMLSSSSSSSSSSASSLSSSPSPSFVSCRLQENLTNTFNSKVLITPSPFQQLSHHQLPPDVSAVSCPTTTATTTTKYAPPPAHSASATTSISLLGELCSFGSCSDSDVKNNGVSDDDVTCNRFAPKKSVPIMQMRPLNLGFKIYSKVNDVTNERAGMSNVNDRAYGAAVMQDIDDVVATPHDLRYNYECEEMGREIHGETSVSDDLVERSFLFKSASDDNSSLPAWQEVDEKGGMSLVTMPMRYSSLSTPTTKVGILSVVDGDSSNCSKPANYRGHKLKKTWLQRHSGEDALEVKNDRLVVTTIVAAVTSTTITDLYTTSTFSSSNGSHTRKECDSHVVPITDIDNTIEKPVVCDSAVSTHSAILANESENLSVFEGPPNNKSFSYVGSMAVNSMGKIHRSKQTCNKIQRNGGGDFSSVVMANGYLSPGKTTSDVNSDDSSGSAAETETKAPLSQSKNQGGSQREQNTVDKSVAGMESAKRKKLHSCSSTDSEKGSASEKELDAANNGCKETSNVRMRGDGGRGDDRSGGSRKRGRKPKISGSSGSGGYSSSGGGGGDGDENSGNGSDGKTGEANDFFEEPKEKRFRDESREQKNPFRKPAISYLKKTGESFLQDGPCHEVAPKLAKCRECRWTLNQRSKSNSNIFCRFYAFRRLRYTKNGQLAIAGFSDPHTDAGPDDIGLWLPNTKNPPTDLDLEVARFTLVQLGDQFCDLLTQEAEAVNIHIAEDKKIAWKRVVQGVREMCDVCETTLFNFHWACGKCGFVVCIDCYKARKNGTVKMWRECAKDRDDLSWLLCTSRQPHEQEKLMLTQIIAGDALMILARLAHETRAMWDIAMFCGCPMMTSMKPSNGVCKEILRSLKREKQKTAEQRNGHFKNENVATEASHFRAEKRNDESDSPLNWLADVALSNQNKPSTIFTSGVQAITAAATVVPITLTVAATATTVTATTVTSTASNDDGDSSDDSEDGNFSTLRELLIRPSSNKSANSTYTSATTTIVGPCTIPALPSTITTATTPTGVVTTMTSAATSEEIDSQPVMMVCSAGTTISSSNATTPCGTSTATANKSRSKKSLLDNFDLVLSNVGECIDDNGDDFLSDDRFINNSGVELKYFVRRHTKGYRGRGQMPIRIMTLSESKLLYPDVPHSWLCDGKLLRLLNSTHPGNYTIFQDQWRRGQPVIVSDVTKRLDPSLWHPDSFIKDFGEVKNDLINCMTGNVVPNQPMRKFWEGFEYLSRRLKDEKGNDMLLKLKDWPPGEDFAEMLPSRYNDLMKVLPLGEYTQRSGRLNLASRLPECFVRPDLGPKMYNAYGSAVFSNKGTTNLHLDISDAVNVMVYVGIPKDADNEEHIKEAYRAIDEAGCDILTRRRIREKGELPGALWHIYSARDADKIRDLLNKVAIERGVRLEPNHDPIHDQSCYLDGSLRERLFKEYSVEGYAIVQCMGDAVFVPAGAPHQVRNLHNCIKVAEDFVSPENVSHCFHLTQEFRELSDTHSNHEDKLQIKNIMYHAVKDSLSVLDAAIIRNSRTTNESPKDGDGAGNGNRTTAVAATTTATIFTRTNPTDATAGTDSAVISVVASTVAKTVNMVVELEDDCETDS